MARIQYDTTLSHVVTQLPISHNEAAPNDQHLRVSVAISALVNRLKTAKPGSLERIQEKWPPVFRPNARQNKDLEHVRDAIFCQRALADQGAQDP